MKCEHCGEAIAIVETRDGKQLRINEKGMIAVVLDDFGSFYKETPVLVLHHCKRDRWISVEEELPEEDEIVFCYDGKDINVGGYADMGDGWFWGRCYDTVYYSSEDRKWLGDIEVDNDYEITHWKRMPNPPVNK